MCKPDSPNTMTHGKQSKVATNGFCLFQSDLAAAMIHTPYASCAVLVLIVIDHYCASVKLLKGCSIAMAEHRTWQTWILGKDIPVEVAEKHDELFVPARIGERWQKFVSNLKLEFRASFGCTDPSDDRSN